MNQNNTKINKIYQVSHFGDTTTVELCSFKRTTTVICPLGKITAVILLSGRSTKASNMIIYQVFRLVTRDISDNH